MLQIIHPLLMEFIKDFLLLSMGARELIQLYILMMFQRHTFFLLNQRLI